MGTMRKTVILIGLVLLYQGIAQKKPVGAGATVAEAHRFIVAAEKQVFDLNNKSSRASWVQENFITDDTENISADAQKEVLAVSTDLAMKARRFEGLKLPPLDARKFLLLKTGFVLAAPRNPAAQDRLTKISVSLDSDYGKGKYCPDGAGPGKKCLTLNDLERIMTNSRDPNELLKAWKGWHSISPPMRKRYTE